MSKADAPTLDGYITPDGIHVIIWCRRCRKLHSHGHGGPDAPLGAGNGHRVAHCLSESGYDGYCIREVGWFTSEEQERRYERTQAKLP